MSLFKYLFLMTALMMVSCKSEVKNENAPRKVKCSVAVKANENYESFHFPGKIIAATDINLGFRIPGIIDEICANDGAYVRKGEVIAKLDNRDYKLQLSATQAEYDAIKAEVDRIVALYADESVSANNYDKATNGLRAITAKLESHKNALADTELRSPIDGYIHKSNFGKGEAVAAGTPVISIISDAVPEITIDIPAAYYLQQDDFLSASATIDLFGDRRFDLYLKGISHKANLNQLYRATFAITNIDEALPSAGMSAMVEMCYKKDHNNSVTIPFSAIFEQDNKSNVWIVSNGCAKSQVVQVREIKSNGYATIRNGINAGDTVVIAGVNSLKEGQQVTILEETAPSNVGGIK